MKYLNNKHKETVRVRLVRVRSNGIFEGGRRGGGAAFGTAL
jgi:hypothetical protein